MELLIVNGFAGVAEMVEILMNSYKTLHVWPKGVVLILSPCCQGLFSVIILLEKMYSRSD
jgi:hypothetical protein